MNLTFGNSSNGTFLNDSFRNDSYSDADTYALGVQAIIYPIIFVVLMIVGVVGNGTLIFIVLRKKSMRNVPNILIVSLSFGDLILLTISAPFSAIVFNMPRYPFPVFVCKLNEYLQTLSLGVSVFTLTALSGDRYVAIVHPMSKHKGKPTLKIVITVVVIWVVSAILAIPDAVSYTLIYSETGHVACYISPETWPMWYGGAHTLFRFVVLFLIPLLVISTFYCLMAHILIKSSRQLPCETTMDTFQSQQQKRQIEARMKVAKVVLSFVILFVICWLPRHIYLLWFYFSTDNFNEFWLGFKVFGFCLTYIYSIINPYALYFLSSQFRKYYNKYLFRCCKRYQLAPTGDSRIPTYSTLRRGSTSLTVVKSHSDM